MLGKVKAFGLAAAVAVVALVPLYGDPRATPVTHAEWARMLLRSLAMDDVLAASGQASQAFSILSWKNSLAYRADRYLRGANVQVVDDPRRVLAVGGGGEVVYPLAVVRGGDYKLRVRIAGNPAVPAGAEITPIGGAVPVKSFRIVPSSIPGWVDAGVAHLDPGAYTAALALPPGTALENVEVAPPCVNAIEPPQGWKATAIVTTTDIAVTALKAMDKESELPAAAAPIEVHGSDFQVAPGASVVTKASVDGGEGLWLKAGPLGLQAIVFVDLPEAGLYAVSTFGIEGGGQSWLADSCRKAVICATTGLPQNKGPQWRTIMTAPFSSGRHFFTVVLGPGAGVERLRLERKKETPADYLTTLRRLGFDPGPDGPVARGKAVDAMNFIATQRSTLSTQNCGDVMVADNPAGLQGFAQPVGPVAGPPLVPPSSGVAPGPVGPGVIPPQPPGSPTTP
jgi:hypothetical protein